jgi:hypothetical protein
MSYVDDSEMSDFADNVDSALEAAQGFLSQLRDCRTPEPLFECSAATTSAALVSIAESLRIIALDVALRRTAEL